MQHFERVHVESVRLESVHFESVRFEDLHFENLHRESVHFESVHNHQEYKSFTDSSHLLLFYLSLRLLFAGKQFSSLLFYISVLVLCDLGCCFICPSLNIRLACDGHGLYSKDISTNGSTQYGTTPGVQGFSNLCLL